MENEVRLAVISDRMVTRMGVRAALSGTYDVQVVVEAHDLGDAGHILQHSVDVVVVDVELFRRHFLDFLEDGAAADVPASVVDVDGDFRQAVHVLGEQVMAHLADLTGREREILMLLGRGLSNRAMASALGLSERTVKVHVGRVLTKLAVESRLQAGLAALIHQMRSAAPGSPL